jgi:hypothetical protein
MTALPGPATRELYSHKKYVVIVAPRAEVTVLLGTYCSRGEYEYEDVVFRSLR